MVNSFNFKGIDSREFEIMIATDPQIAIAERDKEVIEVPGRDGNLYVDKGRYKNISVSYDASFQAKFKDVQRIGRNLIGWLMSEPLNGILMDSYDPDYFRRGRFAAPANIVPILSRAGKCVMTFDCQPFKYSHFGTRTIQVEKTGDIIYNPEYFASNPVFTIYGTGNGNLYINNYTIQIKSINQFIVIDTELMIAFKNTTLLNSSVVLGDWKNYCFKSGENMIQWDGGIQKVEIIPRWCAL